MLRIRCILVPVDQTHLAEHVLDGALTMAERFDASLRVLFVRLEAALPHMDDEEVAVTLRGLQDLVESRRLIGHTLPKDRITVELRTGAADQAILQAASEGGCDLIIMGTHGRKGMMDWLRGSTTERVLVNTGAQMMILRERDEQDESDG